MKSEALFDRTEIERIIHSAKCNRVGYLRRKIGSIGAVSRWGKVGRGGCSVRHMLSHVGTSSPHWIRPPLSTLVQDSRSLSVLSLSFVSGERRNGYLRKKQRAGLLSFAFVQIPNPLEKSFRCHVGRMSSVQSMEEHQ
jgi:hypothetical protein